MTHGSQEESSSALEGLDLATPRRLAGCFRSFVGLAALMIEN